MALDHLSEIDLATLEVLYNDARHWGEWEGDERGLHGGAQAFRCDCGMGEDAACALAAIYNAFPRLLGEVRDGRDAARRRGSASPGGR